MSIFKITSKDLLKIQDGNEIVEIIEKGKYDSYKPDILGLGDISSKSTTVNAVCAIFDLGGFTKFCSKIDPQLVVPEFLTLFLDWLFKQQRKDFITKEYEKGYYVYCNLPFYLNLWVMVFYFYGRQMKLMKLRYVILLA